MDFPELDQWGTPTTKLPDCPRCGEDELGVIHPGLLLCYQCGWKLERKVGPDICSICGGSRIHSRLNGYRCYRCD